MNVGWAMLAMVVCWWMFSHYRSSVKCDYCGSEWRKHAEDCPWGGTGL